MSGKRARASSPSAHELMHIPDLEAGNYNGVIVALDLGTSSGCAIYRGSELIHYEQRKLYKPSLGTHPRDRWDNFIAFLDMCNRRALACADIDSSGVPLFVYEAWVMPLRASGTQAVTIYGGLKALLETRASLYSAISVSQWKKITCGKGNATKQDYVNRANEIAGGTKMTLDDEDACAAICIGYAASKVIAS